MAIRGVEEAILTLKKKKVVVVVVVVTKTTTITMAILAKCLERV